MTVGIIFLMSLATVAAALVTLVRIMGVRRVLRNATIIDIGFTLIVCFALAGTLTGLLIGIVAGLVMTGTLTVWKAATAKTDALRASYAQRTAEPEADDWCPGGTARSL